MTVALVLAAQADAGLCGQLAALGVRRIDAADRGGPGLLTVAAAARAAGERVLICAGDDALPEEILARLLAAGGTAVFTGPPSWDDQPLGHRRRRAPWSWIRLIWARWSPPPSSWPMRPRPRPRWTRCSASSAQRGVSVRVLDAGPDGDGAVAQLIGESGRA